MSTENSTKKNIVDKEKINQGVEKFKKIMKNKKGVQMLGFVLIIMGFIFGYVGSVLSSYSPIMGNSFMSMGQVLMVCGFLFIIYMMVGFEKKKEKKDKKTDVETKIEIQDQLEEHIEKQVEEPSKEQGGVNITGNTLCPECKGDTEIRIRKDSKTVVCIDCGIIIEEKKNEDDGW